MANSAVKTIQEEDEVQYQNLEDLSYFDDDKDTVALYVKNNYEGDIKVWKDSEMDGREYVCINYEIIYLDTIRKF
jgi:hypothetical protein